MHCDTVSSRCWFIVIIYFCSSKFHQQLTAKDLESVTPEVLALHYAKKDIALKEQEFEDVIKQSSQWFGPDWGITSFKKSKHPLTVIVSKLLLITQFPCVIIIVLVIGSL